MARYELSIRDYVRILKKRKFYLILSFIIVVLSSYFFSRMQTPIYETNLSLKFDLGISENNQLLSIFNRGRLIDIDSERETIKSYAVLERSAKILGLAASDNENKMKSVVRRIKSSIKVSRKTQTRILNLSFTHSNPELCAKIINTVANVYIAYNTQKQKKSVLATRQFIGRQVRKKEKEFLEAQKQLEEFRKKRSLIDITILTNQKVTQINSLEIDLQNINNRINEIDNELNRIQEHLMKESELGATFMEVKNDAQISTLKNNIFSLEMKKNELLKKYTEKHPDIKNLDSQIKSNKKKLVNRVSYVIENKILALESEKELLLEKQARISAQIDKEKKETLKYPAYERELDKLQRNVEEIKSILTLLKSKYQEARILEAGEISKVSVIEPAVIPKTPIKPNVKLNITIGILLGFILGMAISFLIESIDTSIGTIEDVEDYVKLPVLGVIPHIKIHGEGFNFFRKRVSMKPHPEEELRSRLITHILPKSPASEAFRTLRTNIQFIGLKKSANTILFTSSGPQEGKSNTIVNLGVVEAQKGNKTLLLSCNLRRPTLNKYFGVDRSNGVTDIIIGNVDWRDAINETGVENLYIIPAGPIPPNPSELLGSPRMDKILNELKPNFDRILVDAPPVLPVTDAAVLGSKVDAVVLIYFVGRAGREALLRAKVQLQNVNCNVIGVVLNDIVAEAQLGPTYYYHYHYYGQSKTKDLATT